MNRRSYMMISQPLRPLLQQYNMDVEVVLKKWGTYKKGDVLNNVPKSTAEALIKAGSVKEAGSKPKKK